MPFCRAHLSLLFTLCHLECSSSVLLLGLNNFVACQGEVEEIELQNKNLRKENEELKASCASLEKQNISLQEKLNKTQVNKKVNKRSQKLQF